jgi:hypothetical protein
MQEQGLLGGIAAVIIVALTLIYAGIQTDSFISGILIIIGLVVLIGGVVGVIKKFS